MANRSFHPDDGSLEIGVVRLYADVAIGGTGACTLTTAPGSKGIASIVRNSAGKYTVTFSDTYQKLLWASCQLIDSTLSNPTTVGMLCSVFSEAASNATPTVVFQFYNFTDGSAADPHSGARLLMKFDLRNSTVI